MSRDSLSTQSFFLLFSQHLEIKVTGEVEIEGDKIMEDFPVRNITGSKETHPIEEMGLINHRDEELCLTEDHRQEVLINPVWIQER